MAVKDTQTENQIKEAAKQIFLHEGRFKATTQEIADAAGVNRTLVNYYFRSRDFLFDLVLQEARDNMHDRLELAVSKEHSFRKRIENFIDVYLERAVNYPYLDVYLISRMNDDYNKENPILADIKKSDKVKEFLKDVETEMDKGVIHQMPPVHFMLNIMSLLSYPVMAQPLYKRMLNLSDKQYQQLILSRKEIILKTLFK
jgi:AcrR family transcriptional regulator